MFQYRNFNLIKPEYLQYAFPMGRTKAVLSSEELINTPEARSQIASFQRDINAYQKSVANRMHQNYLRDMAAKAYQRAASNFSPDKLISNYINRLK